MTCNYSSQLNNSGMNFANCNEPSLKMQKHRIFLQFARLQPHSRSQQLSTYWWFVVISTCSRFFISRADWSESEHIKLLVCSLKFAYHFSGWRMPRTFSLILLEISSFYFGLEICKMRCFFEHANFLKVWHRSLLGSIIL